MCVARVRHVSPNAWVVIVSSLLVLATAPASARGADAPEASLTPCLAPDAAGDPIYPTTAFLPAGKELVAVFVLGSDDKFEKLTSRWTAVDVGDAGPPNTKLAENVLELKGQRKGMLRYSQSVPLPVGKYRLDVLADGKDWKKADLTVIAPASEAVERDKAAPLFELTDGKVFDYQLTSTPGPGVKLTIPHAKPDESGVIRADLQQRIGKPDENGIPVETSINGQVVSTGWLKNDGTGLQLTHHEKDDKPVKLEEPHTFFKLPLAHGTEWPYKVGTTQGVARVWGPLPVEGPDGAKPGWVVVSKEDISIGEPGTSSARGAVTTERHFLPGYGMVKEVRTSATGNKLDSRQQVALKTDKAFEIVANPKMKGRLGRMVFKFPEGSKCESTKVTVLKAGGKEKVHDGFGNQAFDLLPGTYAVLVAGKLVDGGQVKSGHETSPIVGVLRLNADSSTKMEVLDADKKTEVYETFGSADVGLPVGTYHVRVSGQTEEVKVEAGKVTEF